jgi:hypothetical protein
MMVRSPIQTGKLLYHLTSADNIESILTHGLKSRSDLNNFDDVAEPDIILFRQQHDLDSYVPFHFFCNNPFDVRVQKEHPQKSFMYICVQRTFAGNSGFKIIPKHPKAMSNPVLFAYDDGFKEIDWDTMNRRDYSDDACRHICMAECLSLETIEPDNFHCIIAKDDKTKEHTKRHCLRIIGRIPFYIDVNESMFTG